MGIPYYFYTLTKSYSNIMSNKLPCNPDIYCMDFNGVIHPVCAKLATADEEHIINELYIKVVQDISVMKPKKIFICVDGIVPLAKMIQQRKRRYLSVYRNKIDNHSPIWDTNAITPGTEFMKKLNNYFKRQIRYNTLSTDMYYSGSDEYGEGEHKIFAKLKSEETDASIIINGLDADLIILCLMSHRKNIYLMRETADSQTYLNIENLRAAIIQELTKRWNLESHVVDEKDVIESYCVMCSLLGNDFLPHLLTLNLKADGLDRLILLTGTSYNTYGLLVQNSTINYAALSDILQQLAKSEDKDIYNETDKYIKSKRHDIHNTNKSEFYAIKNKDSIAEKIYSDIEKWRQTYYKYLFHTNIAIDSSVIQIACAQYITGIYWTYAYYKQKPHDNTWYYPYEYPPSVKDIANYSLGTKQPIMRNKQVPLTTTIQLMIVLPYESKHLIDSRYQKFMEDTKYGLYHLYPKSYTIRTYLKTHLWECSPCLPTINIDYIRNHIK
jgi:5'-3' exonuclease